MQRFDAAYIPSPPAHELIVAHNQAERLRSELRERARGVLPYREGVRDEASNGWFVRSERVAEFNDDTNPDNTTVAWLRARDGAPHSIIWIVTRGVVNRKDGSKLWKEPIVHLGISEVKAQSEEYPCDTPAQQIELLETGIAMVRLIDQGRVMPSRYPDFRTIY
jgi:hypothetical protein